MLRKIWFLAFSLFALISSPAQVHAAAAGAGPRLILALPFLLGVTGTQSETVPYGTTVNFYPVFNSGTGVITDSASNVIASNVTSGNAYPVGPMTASQVYTLTVTNLAGDQVTGTATVTVTAPVLASVSPATVNLTSGYTQTFASSVTGATNTTVTWSVDGVSGGNASVGTISAGGLYTAGTTAGAHTITATAAANGATQTATATVYAAPSVTTFSASTTTPLYGATVTLTPTFTGGTGSVSNGIGAVTSGTGYPTAAITSAQSYVLTVTNTPGQTATSSTVTVTPQSVALGAVSPLTVNLTSGFTQTFAASVTGASNTTVTWSVDGVSGGNASVGTISAGGLYTAGTTAGAHTITATAAANGATQTATATVYAAPSVTTFSASTTTPLYGATVTLTPTFTGGTGSVSNGIGAVTSGTGYPTAAITSAQSYVLTVTNTPGQTATSSTVTVTPQSVVLASVSPATVNLTSGYTQTFASSVTGATNTTVTWSVDGVSGGNASVGTISAGGLYTAGTTAGAHTITATAAANGATQTATATVYAAPSVTTFSASTTTPLYGATVTLTPTFTGGTGSVSNGIGAVTSGTGYPTAAITSAQGYVLTVTNTPGQTATSSTVTVTPQSVALGAVSPLTVNLTSGFTQTFAASVTGASNTTVTWSVDGVSGGNASVGTISAGGLYTAGTTAGAHTITATAAANGATQTATATVYAAPSVTTFSASTTTPLYGATVTLTPTFTGGTGSVSNGIGAVTSGTGYPTAAITSAQSYVLTVTNTPGQTATSSTVTVTPQSVVLASVSPATVNLTSGYTQTFASSVTGATNTTVTWSVDGVSGGNASVGTISAGGLYTAGTTAGAHTITATAAANGATQTATATVYAAPSVTTFSASTTTPLYGATVTLTPTFTGGTGSVSNGIGAVTSGTGYPTAAITSAQSYVLTVTNTPGQTATSSTVTVTPQSVVLASVSPATVNLTSGYTQTFASSVTGATNTTVTWSVDGVSGGNASVGTISAGGLYTAGTTAGAHTITATAAANGATKTATATVYAAPSVTTFSASPSSISSGSGSILSYTFSGGTACIGTTAGASNTAASVTSGGTTNVSPTVTTTYYLTVTNTPGQTASGNTTVTVTAATAISAVTPATPSIPMGTNGALATETFSATVTGNANTTVNWTCSAGSINSSGVWSATGCNPGAYTITATAAASGTVTSSTTITLTDPGFSMNEGVGGFYNVGVSTTAIQPMSHGWTHQSRFYGPTATPSQKWYSLYSSYGSLGGAATYIGEPVVASNGLLVFPWIGASQGLVTMTASGSFSSFALASGPDFPTIIADGRIIASTSDGLDTFTSAGSVQSIYTSQCGTRIDMIPDYVMIGVDLALGVYTFNDGQDVRMGVEEDSFNVSTGTVTAIFSDDNNEEIGSPFALSATTYGMAFSGDDYSYISGVQETFSPTTISGPVLALNDGTFWGISGGSPALAGFSINTSTEVYVQKTAFGVAGYAAMTSPSVSYSGTILYLESVTFNTGCVLQAYSYPGKTSLWSYALTAAHSYMATQPIFGRDGTAYVVIYDETASTTTLYAFTSAGAVLWTYALPSHLWQSPGANIGSESIALGEDGTLYVALVNGVIALR